MPNSSTTDRPSTPYPPYSALLAANRRAAAELADLLSHLERPGSWEFTHVSALEVELRGIQNLLAGRDAE